jgi:hypothetical protein
MEVLIGRLADAWAPQIADQYLNVLAAEGIAKSILREEIGAACVWISTRASLEMPAEFAPAGDSIAEAPAKERRDCKSAD